MGLELGRLVKLVIETTGDDPKEIEKKIRIIRESIADLEKNKEPSATQSAELERLKNQLSEWESKL